MFSGTFLNSKNGPIPVDTPENYQVSKIINEGAQGIVIEAWDQVRARRLAIKKLKDVFSSPEGAKQCYREFVLGATVQHENIIRVIDAYSPQQHWYDFRELYLVFDYMDCNLAELNANRRELFEHPQGGCFVATLMRQLLCAVKHLHQERLRLIHRDIKPSNILVRHDGSNRYHLKLADLGSARQLPPDDVDVISRYVVTRPYRAPEIILTDSYERPVDLWSVGCVLAELIINRVLFDERDQLMLVYCIMGYVGVTESEIRELPEFVRQNVYQNPQRFTTNHLDAFLRRKAETTINSNWNLSAIGLDQLIDLTMRLLTFNPVHRITAEQALNLPMWEPMAIAMGNTFHNNGNGNGHGHAIYHEDNQHRSGDQWRQVLFNQLQTYTMMANH